MMEKLQQLPQQQQEQQQQLQQQQQQHQQQQLQQQMLQQQLHRAHLELGAAHQRISKNDETTALLEIKMEELEFRRAETKKKHEGELAAVTMEMEEGRSFLSHATTNLSDLQQLVQQQWQQWDQHHQQLSQVTADVLDLQQQRTPPFQPSNIGSSSQAGASLKQEDKNPGPPTATQSTQTPGPLTPSALGQPFPDINGPALDYPPLSLQQGKCGSSVASQPAPAEGTMPPPDGAGSAPRAFPSVGLTLVLGLMLLGTLGIPAALASTLVTPPPSTTEPGRGLHEGDRDNSPPPGSTGSGSRGRPVSETYTLRALKCPASTARLYPVDTVCGVGTESRSKPFSTSQAIRRKAFLLQRDRMQKIDLWRCSKHTSSRATHCGFQSWSSPEGYQDKVFEPTRVTPEECLQAIRQHLWTDPKGDIHQVDEGVNVLSYVSLGALDYRSSDGTWACRGGDRVNSAGNQEVSVLERQSVQFTIKSLVGVYSTIDRSVQVSPSIVLPADRWSSSGTASVEGDVYLRDQPGVPTPTCNLKLIRGPLDFVILPPEGNSPYYVAVNIPSRVKVSYQQPEIPIPKACQHGIGQHRRAFRTNYRDILLLVEDQSAAQLGNITLGKESLEVHLPLQERSRLDFLDWSLRLRLEDLSAEMRRTRCLQTLHEDYSLRASQQPGWRVISRGELLVLVRCSFETVRPLLTASTCSKQLSVVDVDGKPWRLHAGNRLLTDFGQKVPCGTPSPVFTFKTEEGPYVSQSPQLQEVPVNFNSNSQGNTLPSFLTLEEDKLLVPSLDPFQDPGGLYSEEEIEGDQEAYLREWSILVGTPAAALLKPEEPSPPASAASSAHARAFQSNSEAALQGVEAFIRGSLRAVMGRVLSTMEHFVLTLLLMFGNLYAVVLLISKVGSTIAHLCGCIGAGSKQSWQDSCMWAFCGPLKLATTARRGFQVTPPPPAPSAPLLEQEAPEAGAVGGDGSPPSASSSSKPFLKWKYAKKSRRKAQAPVAPGPSDESLTHLGYKRDSPAGPTALPPTSSGERRKRPAPAPIRLPPAPAASGPPSIRGRSASTPRRASRQEEVEILLPQSDALASDLAKVFFKRGPT